MNDKQTVRRHKIVTMPYSLCNAAGIVMREADSAPVSYLHGVGGLFSRLERELESHAIGDIVTVRLLPDDAFGNAIPTLFARCRSAIFLRAR
jgi:FKBP-type peptidyl-prolyl cis-trans isomerase SlyD